MSCLKKEDLKNLFNELENLNNLEVLKDLEDIKDLEALINQEPETEMILAANFSKLSRLMTYFAKMKQNFEIIKDQLNKKTSIISKINEFIDSVTFSKIFELTSITGGDYQKKKDKEAFVSYIESVDKFWIQEEKSTRDLELMEEKLSTAISSLPILTKIEDGLICVAKYSLDYLYYRAYIISHNDQEATVLFIDYGNTEQCKNNDLREISEDLANVEPLARKCCLVKPTGVEKWPENINEEFKKLSDIRSSVFLLDILEVGETCFVKLSIYDYDVAQELIEMSMKDNEVTASASRTEERLSPIGQGNSSTQRYCKICHFVSLRQFWIQHDSLSSQLNYVTKNMKYAQYFEKISDIDIGDIIAVKYENLWYRARVIFYDCSFLLDLILIDFGFKLTNIYLSPEFRQLPKDLLEIEPLATQCCFIEPRGLKNWPKGAEEKFSELEKKKLKFELEVLLQENTLNINYVTLYYNGRNVAEIILNDDVFNETITLVNKQLEQNSSTISSDNFPFSSENKSMDTSNSSSK